MRKAVSAVYENGVIRFVGTIKLGRKLPLRNHTRLRLTVDIPRISNPVLDTFGIIRVPKRIARWAAESPELSLSSAP
jgi:hypothetical protein